MSGKAASALQSLVTFALLAFALTFSACAYLAVTNQVTFARILSNSMAPNYLPGDFVIVQSVPATGIHAGDVVVLANPRSAADVYAHRVESVQTIADHITVSTKGDNNPQTDPWHSQLAPEDSVQLVLGRVPLSAIGSWQLDARASIALWLLLLGHALVAFARLRRAHIHQTHPLHRTVAHR